jgi:hypothetical protein
MYRVVGFNVCHNYLKRFRQIPYNRMISVWSANVIPLNFVIIFGRGFTCDRKILEIGPVI